MNLSVVQTDIAWEDKQTNLQNLRDRLTKLCGRTDIVVLPEMFSTGFTMNSEAMAEPVTGETITTLRSMAAEYQVALAGSYIAQEQAHYYNRAFFLTPEGEAYYYDKRHLFRMGDEGKHFSAGDRKLIIPYRGWNICLLVCYDLRFPVWSRNLNNEYDLLIYTANWPTPRRHVWDTLLAARAIENMSYVCGANRIGEDSNRLAYNGGSAIYSPKGESIAIAKDNEDAIITARLNRDELTAFREKFPVWRDADKFEIQPR